MNGRENEARTGASAKNKDKLSRINPYCRDCIYDCKQDINTKVVYCPCRVTKKQAASQADFKAAMQEAINYKRF